MAIWDSADLLSRVGSLFPRPSSDELVTTALKYQMLGDAQRRVVTLIAFHCPEQMYGAPTLLSSADSGATYTFGTDAQTGGNIHPIGHVELRESPTGAMIPPASEWDTTTQGFLFEGDKIRWPGQKTRTFSDGPYARFITMPGVLDGSTAPTLKPIYARELLVYDACSRLAAIAGVDPSPYDGMFNARWPEILSTMQTAFHGTGVVATQGNGSAAWWRPFV